MQRRLYQQTKHRWRCLACRAHSPEEHAQCTTALCSELQATHVLPTDLSRPPEGDVTRSEPQRLFERPELLLGADDQHSVDGNSMRSERRRIRFMRWRDPCAPATVLSGSERREQRQNDIQLAAPEPRAQDFDQSLSRPAATGQNRIEGSEARGNAVRSRDTASAPDGGMFQQAGERLERHGDGPSGKGTGYCSPVPLPRRTTPTTMPSMSNGCCLRSTLMGSKSEFSGNSHTTEPSWR